MAKTKSVFFCQSCGYEAPKWLGKCPACGEWNTFAEEKITVQKKSEMRKGGVKTQVPVRLSDIKIGRAHV